MKYIIASLTLTASLLFNACATGNSGGDAAKPPALNVPTMTIIEKDQKRVFTRAELLASPALKSIEVAQDPVYRHHDRKYQAVPAAELFKGMGVDPKDSIVFTCLDGFSAPIPAARLLNTDPAKSIAYLAIETPEDKWPHVKSDDPNATAGPFYLVWDKPKLSKIVAEEWPFQLKSFEVQPPVEAQFPAIVPPAAALKQPLVKRGFAVFTQNCLACHSFNGQGRSNMGPDLNDPQSPVEYLTANAFKRFVRDPQSLRTWKNEKMPKFTVNDVSDVDFKALVAYMHVMAKARAANEGP